jgi:dihydroorotase
VELVESGTTFNDRVNQVDVRVSKLVTVSGFRMKGTVGPLQPVQFVGRLSGAALPRRYRGNFTGGGAEYSLPKVKLFLGGQMSRPSRRRFLGQLGAAAAVAPMLREVFQPAVASAQAQNASATYDVLIVGGQVIDPSQNLSAVRDVAILNGRIVQVAANIPRTQARRMFDATGKLVTPGLIDIHGHVYEFGTPLGVSSDVTGVQSGVTTIVDAGSVGASMFTGFRKFVISGATTRIYVLLNISTAGCCLDEIYMDPRLINKETALRTIEANRDLILGIKVRVRGKHSDLAHDIGVLKQARQVADAAGIPIMMHWSNEPDLLALLKRGDILCHPYNPSSADFANAFGADGNHGEKVVPQIIALKERGIWTQGEAATTHTQWDVIKKAASQGWFPDAIATDLARLPDRTPASVLEPMTAMLHFGLGLEQVIERVTATPAKMLNYPEKVGTLQVGATGDVAVLELAKGNFELLDAVRPQQQKLAVTQRFNAVATLKGGVFVKGAPT